MLKYSQHTCLGALNKIFNVALSSGKYPYHWACGYITPLPNYVRLSSGARKLQRNHNYKLYGKIIQWNLKLQTRRSLTKNNLINNLQIGFKKKSRTSDHMFILKTLIDKAVHGDKKNLYACFVDFQKAFDRVPHEALFYKLLTLGINGKLYEIVKDMYSKTCLTVKVNDKLTPAFR